MAPSTPEKWQELPERYNLEEEPTAELPVEIVEPPEAVPSTSGLSLTLPALDNAELYFLK